MSAFHLNRVSLVKLTQPNSSQLPSEGVVRALGTYLAGLEHLVVFFGEEKLAGSSVPVLESSLGVGG